MSSQAERLRYAAAAGNADQVRALLDGGAKIECDSEGRSALHLAAANGHVDTVKALLDVGAKINALDAAGYSPLHQAAAEGHEEVVRVLLKNGCHVDTQDELHGNTALHEAAWKGFSRTLEILCRHRANVYIKNNGGFTPLHLACQNGHNQCCRILLLSACKPDVRNSYGDTPLHTAARYGHAGVLRILISAFCNVNETNKNGDTALHISAAMGRNKLTRILLEAGCDQRIKNNQGEMARDIASRKEFHEVVKLLDSPPVTLIPVQESKKKDSSTTHESGAKEKKDKSKKSKKNRKVHFTERKGSPYGCHLYPDMRCFPQIKLKSLPHEPLKSGEQYYADLAGNIKKGPRGLGYMCYCAPFFSHVEKKLDANKKELLEHIDSKNEDLKAKITHLEKRTHDQLFTLNQKMKESLAIERGQCAERIDRRLFRERREMGQQQRAAQSGARTWLQDKSCVDSPHTRTANHSTCNGNFPLMRSRSEDLLSETNSNPNSVSLLSSTVTGLSQFTNNVLHPAQCGTKPKLSAHMSNASRIKVRCFGYPELKRESRSEGDLTNCHAEAIDYNSNTQVAAQAPQNIPSEDAHIKYPGSNHCFSAAPSTPQSKWSAKPEQNGKKVIGRNSVESQPMFRDKSFAFQLDLNKCQSKNYLSVRSPFHTKHNHDQNIYLPSECEKADLKTEIRTQTNGLSTVQRRDLLTPSLKSHSASFHDRGNGLSPVDSIGSSFV